MSIEEKLTTIAENEQKVYDAGFAAGQAQGGGEDSQWWLDWFESKTDIKNLFLGSAITYIPEFLDFSHITNANFAFRQCLNIQQESFYMNSCNAKDLGYLFYQSNCGLKELTIDVSNAENISGLVGQDCSIQRVNFIGNCSKVKESTNLALWGALKEIHCYTDETMTEEIPLDFSNNTSANTFYYAPSLKSISFAPECIKVSMVINSSVLTNESIQSVIDGLADLTGGTTQTLTVHSTVGNNLTDTQKATITAKNWTLVY